MKPELLQHPQIPKPLHGLAPRVIKGQDWWDVKRQEAYASTNYHCAACGVHKSQAKEHQWLEAHEDYEIDYAKGSVTINKIVPLCHYCHNFIHSGRLWMVNKDNPDKIKRVLEHGIKICEDNFISVQHYTLDLADEYDVEHYCGVLKENITECAEWSEWHLILEGEKYYTKYKDFEEWKTHYNN